MNIDKLVWLMDVSKEPLLRAAQYILIFMAWIQ